MSALLGTPATGGGGRLGALVVVAALVVTTVLIGLHDQVPSWFSLVAFAFGGHGITASSVNLGKSITPAPAPVAQPAAQLAPPPAGPGAA